MAVGALVVGGAVALPRLLAALQDAGQVVTASPRIVGAIEYGTILAYLSILRGHEQPERDLVCLAVSEFDRQAQADAVSDSSCIERTAFETDGFSTTLFAVDSLIAERESAPPDEPISGDLPRHDPPANDPRPPANDPTAGGEWIAAYIATAVDGSDRQACLPVLDSGVQRENACVLLDEFRSRVLLVQAERGSKTILATWPSTDDVSVLVTTTN